MNKPSEIFDTPEAISRVRGNDEIAKDFVINRGWCNQLGNLGVADILIEEITELLTTKDQEKEEAIRKGWKGYVVVDPKADKYKYSPVFSTVEGAKIWLRGKGLNGLEIVEVDVLLALPTEDNK